MNNVDSPLIFELSREGQKGYSLPKCDVPELSMEKLIGSARYARARMPHYRKCPRMKSSGIISVCRR